jgi:hypothetical protein
VTSNTAAVTRRRHTPLARVLAFVLLAFVAYTTTAESVHRHGGLALKRSESSAATVIRSSGDANPSADDSLSVSDCLICQLRQHLSSSLLTELPQLVAPQAPPELSQTVAPLSASRVETPRRGRAPPHTSLS